MISTLIKTLTASNDATLSFGNGASDVVLDGTYDEYMFVFTDIDHVNDSSHFTFAGSIDAGSNYNVDMTTTVLLSVHNEGDSSASFGYITTQDLATGEEDTGGGGDQDYQWISYNGGNAADESTSGILHLYSPNTAAVANLWHCTCVSNSADAYERQDFTSGFFHTTADIDAVQFKINSGNIAAGTIQMYGIS